MVIVGDVKGTQVPDWEKEGEKGKKRKL